MAKAVKQLITWYEQLENGDYVMKYTIQPSKFKAKQVYDEIASRETTVSIDIEDY